MSETRSPVQDATMASRAQKTFYLDDDISRLIAAHQKSSGASFTRIMTAALLQYFFQDVDRPNPIWMEHAVELGNDEIGVGDIPQQRIDLIAADALANAEVTEAGIREVSPEYRKLQRAWQQIAKMPGDDPVQKIIDFRSSRR